MPGRSPTVSLGLNCFGEAPGGDWRGLLDLARAAEAGGVDRVVVPDHVVNGADVAGYPWGRFPTGSDGDWLEPLTVLSAVAAVTSTLRLGTGVLVAPARPAAVLAKVVATLDVLSAGRVDLGVGTGWQRAELEAAGVDFDRRGQVLTDTVAACRALWAGGPTTFDSPTVWLRDVWCAPVPVQPRLPVWFSGTLHGRNVERIVRLGDGWIPIMGTTAAGLREGTQLLRAAFADAGRDPAALTVRAMTTPVVVDGAVDVGATAERFAELCDAGATDVAVNQRSAVPGPVTAAALERAASALAEAARRVAP